MSTKEVSKEFFSTEKKCCKNVHFKYVWWMLRCPSRKTHFYPFSQNYLWQKSLFWKALVQVRTVSLTNKFDGFFIIFPPWERTAFQNTKITLSINILYSKILFLWLLPYNKNYSVALKNLKLFLIIKLFPQALKKSVRSNTQLTGEEAEFSNKNCFITF